MNYQSLSKPLRWLISASTLVTTTGFLLLSLEAALSIWVYRDKGYVEPAFCKGELAYTASCSAPHPLFHFRIASLALYNAVTMKPVYRARRFEELTREEFAGLDQWRKRMSWKEPLPWNKAASVAYNYDSMGRRVASLTDPPKTKTKFLAFFGGSWVHGDWLPYEQTLPGQAEKRMPDLHIYNYGIQGGGLQEFFLGIHGLEFKKGIPERSGVYVYVHNWMHLDRLRPSVAYIGGRFGSPMASYIKDADLGYGGSFYEGFPVLTPALAFMRHSGIGKLTGLSQKLFPEWKLDKLYCDMLVQTKHKLESENGSKLVVLIYGRGDHIDKWKLPIPCLEKNNIPYLAPYLDGKILETYLPDGHPDSANHEKVAHQFSEWVKPFIWP